jgi:hypothetical protein
MKSLPCECLGFLAGFLIFAGSASAVTWTTIDFPGADSTIVTGINNKGDIVGAYLISGTGHGFLLSGGNYTTIDFPGSTSTLVMGINDQGDMSGYYFNDGGILAHGFLLQSGSFTLIDVPNANRTFVAGLNNNDEVVGFSFDRDNNFHAFKYSAGNFTAIQTKRHHNEPGGINNDGDITGLMALGNPLNGKTAGYLIKSGVVHALTDVGATSVVGRGLNDLDEVVGTAFRVTNQGHAFLFTNGKYVLLNVPGNTFTSEAYGINNAGSIVGFYTGSVGFSHGFLRAR